MYRLAAGGTFKVRLSNIKNPLSAQVFGPLFVDTNSYLFPFESSPD